MLTRAELIEDISFFPNLRDDVATYDVRNKIYAFDVNHGANFFAARVPRDNAEKYPTGNIGYCGDIIKIGTDNNGQLKNFRLADAVSGSINGLAMARVMMRNQIAQTLATSTTVEDTRNKIVTIEQSVQKLLSADEIRLLWAEEILTARSLQTELDEITVKLKQIGYGFSPDQRTLIVASNLKNYLLSTTTFLAGFVQKQSLHIVRVGDPELIIINRQSAKVSFIMQLPPTHQHSNGQNIPGQLYLAENRIDKNRIEFYRTELQANDICLAFTDGLSYHCSVNQDEREDFARYIAEHVAKKLKKNPQISLKDIIMGLLYEAVGYDDCGVVGFEV